MMVKFWLHGINDGETMVNNPGFTMTIMVCAMGNNGWYIMITPDNA